MNMKAIHKLAVLISLGSLLPLAASAKSLEQSYLDSYSKNSGMPVPTAVVSPLVSPSYTGDKVEIEFTVNANGTTSDFSVKSSPDSTLSEAVVAAVKQWQFAPAIHNGQPESTKVLLPVVIVDQGSIGYAAD
jgi:TonB family protein